MQIRLPRNSKLNTHRVFSREDLGLRGPKEITYRDRSDIKANRLHYTTGEELGREDTFEWWRQIQKYHMDTRNWWDIAYHVGVDIFGNILEGRFWNVVGGHASGYNLEEFGIVFLGDDDPNYNDATPEARHAIRSVVEWSDAVAGKTLIRRVHRDTHRTACPGDELTLWWKAGLPVKGWEEEMVSEPVFYGRRGTVDARFAGDIVDSSHKGSYLSNFSEVKKLANSGITVVAIGAPAYEDFKGKKPDKEQVVREGNVIYIVGQTATRTGMLLFKYFA